MARAATERPGPSLGLAYILSFFSVAILSVILSVTILSVVILLVVILSVAILSFCLLVDCVQPASVSPADVIRQQVLRIGGEVDGDTTVDQQALDADLQELQRPPGASA
jgi:hypothetical protein